MFGSLDLDPEPGPHQDDSRIHNTDRNNLFDFFFFKVDNPAGILVVPVNVVIFFGGGGVDECRP